MKVRQPHSKISRELLSRTIVETLGAWPLREREVFIHSHYRGKSANEIAGALGMSVKEVNKVLSSCDGKLRTALRGFRGAPHQTPRSA